MAAILRLLSVVFTLHVADVQGYTLYRWIMDSSTRFNYDPDARSMLGVYSWRNTFPESCGGEQQSPIDIQTDMVRYGRDLPCPRMLYTSSLLQGELKNNGHSATFEPANERAFRLTNIPYRPGVYNLNDFHLHYGGVRGRIFESQGQRFRGSGVMSAGSEHTIDGLRFEGELHFVFYNSKYKDLEEADNKTDGVVIAVLLVQKLPNNVVDSRDTSSFSQFLEMNIPRIAPYQQNITLNVDLGMFFNRDCQFYTYFGSTTTPVCHESVQWFIIREPIRVTERAWFQLTRLQSRGDFNARFGNYRNTQPMNNRIIEANFLREVGPVLPSPNSEMIRPRSERMPANDGMQGQSQRPMSDIMPDSVVMQGPSQRPMSDIMPDSVVMQGPSQRPMSDSRAMMGTNIAAPMENNQTSSFGSMGIADNQANMIRSEINQVDQTFQDIRNFLKQRPSIPDMTRMVMPRPDGGLPNDFRRQERNEIMMQLMRPLSPHSFGGIIDRNQIQGSRSSEFNSNKKRNMEISQQRQEPFVPSSQMKETFMNGFYVNNIWKKLCDLWNRKSFY